MKNKTPWYIYPPDEPKKNPGDDALGALVGILLLLIIVLVAVDHALYNALTMISGWWDSLGLWPGD